MAQKLSKQLPVCMPIKPSPFWTKRLVLALIFSVALHLLLVRGLGLQFPDWWSTPKPYGTIDAVLVAAPKAPPPSVEKLVPVRPTRAAKPATKKPLPTPLPPQVLPPNNASNETVATNTESAADAGPAENALPEQPVATNELSHAGVEDLPKPPVFLETDFAISKGGTKGVMHNTYQVQPDGSYVLKSEVEAKGLASLFLGKLKQQSDGIVTEHGLKPSHYLYQYGKDEDKAQHASFDWQANTLTMQNGKKIKIAPLAEGTQDFLSFMYQFMFVPPLEEMQLTIANGKKLGTYDYGFEGEETLSTKIGELRTVHIFRSRADSDEKTEFWLALDYYNLPVKVRQTDKDGSVIEQIVTQISTSNNAPAP
jgi:Protein of unknown function (DUF3108)